VHETLIFEYVAKVIPDVNHSFIHAFAALPATPPIVFATPQKRQPPEIQAGCNCGLCKGHTGGHIHGRLLLWVVTKSPVIKKI